MRKTVKAFIFLAVCCIVVGAVWMIVVAVANADEALSLNRRVELFWKPSGLMLIAVLFYWIAMKKLENQDEYY